MTYAPRVHFRILIWDGLFVFFEANFCFLVTCSFLYCFQSVVKICARKGYIILAKCFLMNEYGHSISFFLEKKLYFGILKSELCCIIWNKYNSCRYCLRVNCSLFNQVCQLFSINIASVFILAKCNTVYDSFSRWKAFFCLSYFLHCCERATKID